MDEFKDGAFRLAIEHHIPIVPMTFADNKKRLSYTFLSGSPGLLRAMVHNSIETKGLSLDNKKELKEVVLNAIGKYKNKKVRVINLYPSTLSTHKTH